MNNQLNNLPSLPQIIDYLKSTSEDSWCVDVVKSNGKNCLFGHLFDIGGSLLMDVFEESVATTFMVYEVNDGRNQKYQQSTPKDRCIAYLTDILNGKEKTTQQLLDEYER